MGARGRHVAGRAAGAERGGTRGAMAGPGDDGSWVELRCGPGCPEPAPSRFSSCHADVERMLLEAQLETESGDGAVFTWGSPARGDDGAIQENEQPGESERLPPCSQCPPGCPHPRQRDVPEGAERRERRLPAPLGWSGAPRPQHLSPNRCCGACREVQWGGRRDFSVQSCCCSSSPRCCSATC
ncbi:uncharacterized protein LOC141959854 isoform X2 [Athene noctua]|uniref:uncharacterized protein LOC141959854 isoform X2 n=1 Tax=Athene noctua TaxID=126797 RepID=UPI003EBBF078